VKSRWPTDASFFLIGNVGDCDFVVLVRLSRGRRYSTTAKQTQQPEDPEYYVLTADDAKSLIIDQEKGWTKIRWQKQNFEVHRRRWDLIMKFLRMPKNEKGSKGQIA
jgi:hypothetical protein